jgi:transcriptional regulator with XRE-family HTH domain
MGKTLGRHIREARERCGMTQNELGQRIGAREAQISDWERGKNEPRVSTLVDMAREFGCTVDELVSDDEAEAEPAAAEA